MRYWGLTGAALGLCTSALAQPQSLARAEELIGSGEWRKALPLLEGADRQSRLLRALAFLHGRQISQADPLVEALREETAVDPKLADHRYYLVLGRWARATGQTELAVKALGEARRMAETPDQTLDAIDRLILIFVVKQDWDRAEALMTSSNGLLAKLQSSRSLANHLAVLAELQTARGRQAEALASLASARALFKSLGMPAKAAEMTLKMSPLLGDDGDKVAEWQSTEQAFLEYLALEDADGVYDSLVRLTRLAVPLAEKKQPTAARLRQAFEGLPPGSLRTMLEIESLRYRSTLGESGEALKGVQALLERADVQGENRLLALDLAAQLAGVGGRKEALEYWSQALRMADTRHAGERRAFLSRGSLRVKYAELLRVQGDYRASLASIEQALSEQLGADWRIWRIFIGRYEALLSLLPLHDSERAKEELRSALDEMGELEEVGLQANFLTAILAALSLNRSLGEDELDPAERALGPYDAMSQSLLDEVLRRGDANLKVYDAWVEELRRAGDQGQLGGALSLRSLFLEAAGRKAEARSGLLESIRILREQQQTLELIVARVLLARLENLDGRSQAALEQLEQAAQAGQKLVPSVARFHLMLLASYQGQQGLLEPALESYGKAALAEPSKAWTALYGRSQILRKLGRYGEAVGAADQALAAPEVAQRPTARARLLGLRGELLLQAGKTAEGLQQLETALPLLLASASPELVCEATLIYAEALRKQSQSEQAFQVARRSLDGLLDRRTASASVMAPLFELVATLALEAGRDEDALAYLALSRSAELVASVTLAQVETQNPATARLLEDLDQLKTQLEGLQAEAGREGEEKPGISRALAETRQQFFTRLDELKRMEPDFEALVQLSGSDLSALQSALDEKTVLLEYFPAESYLYIFVVGRQRFAIQRVDIGRAQLEREVAHYGRLVRDPESDEASLATSSHALHALLIDPVINHLEGHRDLLVVPSGPLWNVRFEELRAADGRSLDQRWPVALLTSADVLASLRSEPLGHSGRSEALLLGAPDAMELPGARAELEAIKGITPEAVTLLGAQATSTALKQYAPKARLLHIASHSGLGKSPGQSYISLADGPFSLDRVYGLSLPAGSLVVLSSCQSALGETQPGREVTSLASAFNIAGASTVIASNWEVDDEVTRGLFESFYRNLEQGIARGEALRLARRETALRHPHPYYWAAFSLYGNPR